MGKRISKIDVLQRDFEAAQKETQQALDAWNRCGEKILEIEAQLRNPQLDPIEAIRVRHNLDTLGAEYSTLKGRFETAAPVSHKAEINLRQAQARQAEALRVINTLDNPQEMAICGIGPEDARAWRGKAEKILSELEG